MKRHKGGIMNNYTQTKTGIVDDERIVQLYWERNEMAIQETDNKYGRFLFAKAETKLT